MATQSGVTIPNINAQLTNGGMISGNVSNGQGTGLTVPVRLFSVLDATFARATVTPGAQGNFIFYNVKPGDYRVFFNAAGTAYASEWYADAASFATATTITVTEGNATAGINGVLTAPEINLKQGATDIATGGTYAFGSKVVGTDTDTVFTIENTGTDPLNLTGLPLVIGGTNADQFAVTVQPVSPVAAAGSRTFTVRFHPTSDGAKAAQISIANNDGDENPYMLNLTGTGTVPAGTLTVTSPNGGESWVVGSSHAITWTSTGTIANVKIEFSTNPGADWTTVVASTSNTGTYPWNVPNTPATTCLVRISEAGNAAINDVSNSVFTITSSAIVKENLLGTWDGQGVYYRSSDSGLWTILSTAADLIACGDLYGDGIDDLIGIWSGQAGVWVKDSANGTWTYLGSTPQHIAAGDMNGDGRTDLLGTWDGQGVFYRDATGNWTMMATAASLITTGDLDGDGTDDLVGIWPSQAGVWAKMSLSNTWSYLGTAPRDMATGDMNGDGRVDLIGTWDGQGVYYKDSLTGTWVMMATPADQIAAGDLDGDGTDDLIGIWAGQAGVWVKYSQTQTWAYIGSSARDIAAGKMAGGAWSAGINALMSLEAPLGGNPDRPGTGSRRDESAQGPGGASFLYQSESNLVPPEFRTLKSHVPGPGEMGFKYVAERNLWPMTTIVK